MSKAETVETIIVALIFYASMKIGVSIGGGLGLFVFVLILLGIIMFAYFEYKLEQRDKSARKRVDRMAQAVNKAYAPKLEKEGALYHSQLVVRGDSNRVIAVVRYCNATPEEHTIIEDAMRNAFDNQ